MDKQEKEGSLLRGGRERRGLEGGGRGLEEGGGEGLEERGGERGLEERGGVRGLEEGGGGEGEGKKYFAIRITLSVGISSLQFLCAFDYTWI
jgi:hypothetical protein